jgi:hypothetical protein
MNRCDDALMTAEIGGTPFSQARCPSSPRIACNSTKHFVDFLPHSATAWASGAAAADWSPRKLMAVTISPAAMGLGGRREFRGRATLGIDCADMAPDGLGDVCRMSQRVHMTGVGNLVIAGMR